MTKCRRRLKTCKPYFYHEDEFGHYTCGGVTKRKMRGGVKMDVCRRCFTSAFHRKPDVLDSTPEEALIFALAHQIPAFKWFDNFGPYNEWREENDK